MRIRVSLLIAGVAVLGLVMASPSIGSNMGFKLERNLPANTAGANNFHFMSFPLFRSYADVSTAPNGETKEGYAINDMNDLTGVVDAQDILLDLWNADQASPTIVDKGISLLRYNPTLSVFENVTLTGVPIPGNEFVQFSGSPTLPDAANFSIETVDTEGFIVRVSGNGADAANIQAIIVGSHNPSTTVKALVPNTFMDIYGLPYHTTHTHSDCTGMGPTCDGQLEALLGGAGQNDPCPAGMDIGDQVALLDYDSEAGGAVNKDGTFFNRTATCLPTGVNYSGGDGGPYALTPGNGYAFQVSDPVITDPTLWDLPIPHY
jgi:hypothetical protein